MKPGRAPHLGMPAVAVRSAAAMLLPAVLLLLRVAPASAAWRLRALAGDCPLCVAEDHCHEACADIKSRPPGSKYCLDACTGAHPGDEFGEAFFTAADRKMEESAQLDRNIRELGKELAEDVKR
mmetsp:Transcript_94463/g.192264  ORF Transcript_94463/g.192264 Transcript_94463/m.192264 type:complete len:124 (+) Transcript_94463:57-428(+)